MSSRSIKAALAATLALPLLAVLPQAAQAVAMCPAGCQVEGPGGGAVGGGGGPLYIREAELQAAPVNQESPQVFTSQAACDPGDEVHGGGHQIGDLNDGSKVLSEGPFVDGNITGWTVVAILEARDTIKAVANCRDSAAPFLP